ncbi:MAG: SDR family oxidoreductase [Candidatus Berkelbacteria bacterium]|nr:SDR family oxidoreductase [Candidatus Berkelbacteria bacterium]
MKGALVFGGSGGIGTAIAEELKDLDYKIVVADRRGPKPETCDHYVPVDVTKEADIKRAISFTQDNFGTLDAVINSQGIYILEAAELTKVSDWRKIIEVNLSSVFLVCKHTIPIMKWQRQGGYIINIASMSGLRGRAGKAAYCASKFGVIGLTESIYEELRGTKIRITAVCPASVDTSLTNNKHLLKRDEIEKILQPEDVARAVGELVESNPRVLRKTVVLDIELKIDKFQRLKTSKLE